MVQLLAHFHRARSQFVGALRWLLFVIMLSIGIGASVPAFACSAVENLSAPSGGTAVITCGFWGFMDFNAPNQARPVISAHGYVLPDANNSYEFNYTNNGDGATSDTFQMTDGDDGKIVTFNVTIAAPTSPITLAPATLPAPVIGQSYSQTLSATGGSAPYTYSLYSGILPTGVVLSPAGVISGIPTRAEPFSFAVHAVDSLGVTQNKNYGFTVAAPNMVLTPASPPNASVNKPYSMQFSLSGGTAPYAYFVESGSLPTGLSLSSTGLISGTPTALGSSTFRIKFQDSTTQASPSPFAQVQDVTITVSTAVAPGAPSIGAATAGNGQASIPFAAPASNGGATITGYTVTSSPGGLTASGTTSPISVVGLTNGTPYSFTVTATNSAGTGLASAASNSVTPLGAPGAPTIGTATAGDAQASITFAAPASNGGTAITQYKVTSNPGGFFGTGSASPVLITGLVNGTAYTFTVVATNSVGSSSASGASTAVTPKAPQTIDFVNPGSQNFGTTPTLSAAATSSLTPSFSSSSQGVCTITSSGSLTFVSAGTCVINADQPGSASFLAAPTVSQSFSVNAIVPSAPTIGAATAGSAQVSISFTAPTSSGGEAITSYTATSSPGNFVGSSTSSPIVVAGLTNGTSYIFTVTATNGAGTGAASGASNAVTPKALQTITFNDPGAQNFGTTPILSATASSGLTPSFSSSTTGVCTITGGGALTFVTAGLCTINADQAGNASNLAASTVTRSFSVAAVAAGAPTIGTATAGNTQASVTFTAPASSGGASVTSYTVTSSPGGLTGTGASSPITVTGLDNGTSYTFTVIASTTAGAGAASGPSNAVTPRAAQTITFNNPGAKTFGTTPTLTATSNSGLTPRFSASTTGVCTITMNGALTFVSTGSCTIDANEAGNGNYLAAPTVSQTFSVLAVVPDAPLISAVTPGNTEATIAFTAPSFIGGASITGYTVTSIPNGLTGTGAASPIIVTGLTNGTAYQFTVTATNSAGTGAASAISSSVTPSAAPVAGPVSATVTYGSSANTLALMNSGGVATSVSIGTVASHGTATASGTSISYTPAVGYFGLDTFSYTATNASGTSAPANVQITVSPPTISIAPANLAQGSVGSVYSQSLLATGGKAPYSFATSPASGSLPTGLSLGADGTITGTPMAAGTFSFTVTGTDSSTSTPATFTSASISIDIAQAALSFSPASGITLPPAMAGEAYSQAISATNGFGAVIYSLTGGAMPPDMVLNQTTGELTVAQGDVRATLGSYSFTITATDAHANTGSASYTLEVTARAVTVSDKQITIPPGGTPLPVDLTAGATGGPFTDATVTTVTPPYAGTARVTSGDVAGPVPAGPLRFYLKFTPNPEFSGTAVIGYTLVSALGTANGKISFTSTLDIVKVSERFDSLVHGFIDTRQRLLASGIKVPGLLEHRAMASGNRPGALAMTPNGNSITMNFASSLAELKAWGEAGDAASALAAAPADEPLPFNVWIDGKATVHLRSDSAEDHWGKFALVSVGADYLVNDKLLIGVALHADFMDDLTYTSSTSGSGIMVGPYLSTEIGDGVFLDASAFYGRSWNRVSTDIFGGEFESQRLVVNAKLEGEWALGESLTFRPSATAFYLHETVDDYSVSNAIGEAVALAGFTSDQVRLSAGGVFELETQFGDALTLKPFLGASLGLASVNGTTATGGIFGTLTSGFTLFGDGDWSVGAGLDLGLEASGLKTATAKGKLQVNF